MEKMSGPEFKYVLLDSQGVLTYILLSDVQDQK